MQKFNFILTLLALVALLVTVNSIPLHKRVTTFLQCPMAGNPPLLSVIAEPDPIIPGQTAKFHVSGILKQPITPGVDTLGIILVNNGASVGTPFAKTMCGAIDCPIPAGTEFSVVATYSIPAALPASYGILLFVSDPTIKTVIGCAVSIVDGSGAAPESSAPAPAPPAASTPPEPPSASASAPPAPGASSTAASAPPSGGAGAGWGTGQAAFKML